MFQSTPPYEGATSACPVCAAKITVSIHAPVRGGDTKLSTLTHALTVSIHAPVRGGDILVRRLLYCVQFQSTPPYEGATAVHANAKPRCSVSIHAPVRGGDMARFIWHLPKQVSIHAPVRGGDTGFGLCCTGLQFQSTPPYEGATPIDGPLTFILSGFNPRPRTRGRLTTWGSIVSRTSVSIHAPVRGGDKPQMGRGHRIWGFNPRPRTRGRPPLTI